VSGISTSTRDAGATMQRAQDKIASMQARAGALDELLASGALDDLSQPVDDIQKELDKVSSTNQVDNELAALRAEIGPSGDAAALPAAEAPAAQPAQAAQPVQAAQPAQATEGVPAAEPGGTRGGTGAEGA
jgi:phage shock protein A